ncbi:Uncharacterized protein FKW44_011702 [Caligus rogercresseyi]|uniref:Uncharacterized protein n=1 Tax=Caligus rogercresseyi TaxID=217165 RepID=A0A7T8K8B4_CALRO|nr:Uncharacterized protein FKW44_011702 [Caligus rogercresseyi]
MPHAKWWIPSIQTKYLKQIPNRAEVVVLFRVLASHARCGMCCSSPFAKPGLYIWQRIPLVGFNSTDEEKVCSIFGCQFAPVLCNDIVHRAEPPLTVCITC